MADFSCGEEAVTVAPWEEDLLVGTGSRMTVRHSLASGHSGQCSCCEDGGVQLGSATNKILIN